MPTRRHTVDSVHVQLLIRFPLPLTRSRTRMHAGRWWWKVGMTPTKVASCDALVTWSDARRLRVHGSAPADAVVLLGLGVIDCGGGWMRRRRAVQCSLHSSDNYIVIERRCKRAALPQSCPQLVDISEFEFSGVARKFFFRRSKIRRSGPGGRRPQKLTTS